MDEHGITITASHDVPRSTYCIAVASPAENARSCWPLASIAAGDARGYVANVI